MPAFPFDPAGEDVLGDARLPVDRGFQVFPESAGKVKRGLGGRVIRDELRVAHPPDFDAAEKVCLRSRHAEKTLRLERGALAEDFFVRLEAHLGAAPVLDRAQLLQLALGRTTAERHRVQLLGARDLDLQFLGKCVDHRHTDAVQAA
jgi:hypothetical protein